MSRTAHKNTEQLHISNFYSFFVKHFSSDFSFPGHIHNIMECQYVLKGSICATIGEHIYNISEGEILFIQPLTPHKHHVTSKEGVVTLTVLFDMEGDVCSYFYDKVFQLSEAQRKTIQSMIEYAHKKCTAPVMEEDGRLSQDFLASYDSPSYIQMVTTYVYQLLFSLVDEGDIRHTSLAPDTQIFSTAVSYLNQYVYLSPSIDEVAHHCNTSRSTLIRIFNKYAGMSIHKFLLMLKTKVATELLQSGETVTETANRLGFSSQAYFSACYKRETGMNPSEILRFAE